VVVARPGAEDGDDRGATKAAASEAAAATSAPAVANGFCSVPLKRLAYFAQ
jgi:hypothetical protein